MSDSKPAVRVRQCCKCGTDIEVRSNHPAAKCLECKRPSRVCQHCGKSFHPSTNSDGKFCSVGCWQEWRPKDTARRNKGICDGCGREFSLDRNQRLRRTKDLNAKVFCGKSCLNMRWDADFPIGSTRIPDTGGHNHGYVDQKVGKGYPGADRNGWIRQHRYVMQEHLGRPLEPFENVHHINGIRGDNRIENLELWTKPQPIGQRPEDLAMWVVEHYRELVLAALDNNPQLRLAV